MTDLSNSTNTDSAAVLEKCREIIEKAKSSVSMPDPSEPPPIRPILARIDDETIKEKSQSAVKAKAAQRIEVVLRSRKDAVREAAENAANCIEGMLGEENLRYIDKQAFDAVNACNELIRSVGIDLEKIEFGSVSDEFYAGYHLDRFDRRGCIEDLTDDVVKTGGTYSAESYFKNNCNVMKWGGLFDATYECCALEPATIDIGKDVETYFTGNLKSVWRREAERYLWLVKSFYNALDERLRLIEQAVNDPEGFAERLSL